MSSSNALDIIALTDLVHRLALYSDKAPIEQWSALLTEDFHMDLFGAAATGRAANEEGSRTRRATGRTGPGSNSRHLVTTTVFDVDGDRATGDVTVLFYLAVDTQPSLARIVNYSDRYERTADGWKVAARVATA